MTERTSYGLRRWGEQGGAFSRSKDICWGSVILSLKEVTTVRWFFTVWSWHLLGLRLEMWVASTHCWWVVREVAELSDGHGRAGKEMLRGTYSSWSPHTLCPASQEQVQAPSPSHLASKSSRISPCTQCENCLSFFFYPKEFRCFLKATFTGEN